MRVTILREDAVCCLALLMMVERRPGGNGKSSEAMVWRNVKTIKDCSHLVVRRYSLNE